jgi:anti-anti-sigma regulatory factor
VALQSSFSAASVPGHAPSLVIHLDLVAARLELVGQLDRRTAHLLHDAISALLQTDRPLWTVDVTGLTVADHTGLRAVETAYPRALVHGRALTLLGASPGLHRALTPLDLDHPALGARRRPSIDAGAPGGSDTSTRAARVAHAPRSRRDVRAPR